jgi:preprotein translocase subunit SecA
MLLRVGEGWRIKSDAEQWTVERVKSKQHRMSNQQTEVRWEAVAYCSTLRDAMTCLYRRRIRSIEGDIPERILAEMEKIREEIVNAWRGFDEAPIPRSKGDPQAEIP